MQVQNFWQLWFGNVSIHDTFTSLSSNIVLCNIHSTLLLRRDNTEVSTKLPHILIKEIFSPVFSFLYAKL